MEHREILKIVKECGLCIEINSSGLRHIVGMGYGLIEFSSHGHKTEHAVEVHLPFLQKSIKPL